MRTFARLYVITLILAGLSPITNAQAGGVQMLPPTDYSGQPCSNANSGLLQWDGSTAIKCVPGASGDSGGNINVTTGGVNANKFYVAGSAAAIDTGRSNSLNNLYIASPCTTNQALTKNADGTFSCVSVTDAGAVPNCGPNSALTFANGAFSCVGLVAQPPTCTGNNMLQFDGTNWNCVSAPYTFGGMFTYDNGDDPTNQPGCYTGNPLAGGACTCPSGFTAVTAWGPDLYQCVQQ